jgi:erythritol kinase (D-erythritol 1-phosphate-forming)
MNVLLGVDAGTTAITAVAYDTSGNVLATATETHSAVHPEPGWAEQEMEAVWKQTAAAVKQAVTALDDRAEIVGVGVTGQGDGCWLIDDDGCPVRNAVLWSDSRAASIVEDWEEDGTMAALSDACGSSLYPGTCLPLLAWFAEHSPETLEDAATAFSCKDWLVYNLTGVRGTDYTEATVPFLDQKTGEVNPVVFEEASIPTERALIPAVRTGTDIVGTLTAAAASETGLPAGIPVVAGLIDVATSAIGTGAVSRGDAAVSLGTSLFAQTITESPGESGTGIGMRFGIDDRWTTAVGSNAGTPSLAWICEEVVEVDSIPSLEPIAAAAPLGCEGVCYLPYLSTTGERGPFTNSHARAGFVGLDPTHTQEHVVRSVYEGLSFAVRDCLTELPSDPERVFLTGGGARSAFWCELLADCLGVELVVPQNDYPAAKGAATLLAVALEIEPTLQKAVKQLAGEYDRYRPDASIAEVYDELYPVYRRTRQQMVPVWEDRAQLQSVRKTE